jgi:hypothetical protein
MIHDDWVFVEKYGITVEGVWLWFLWYLVYCVFVFSFCYWTLESIVLLIIYIVKLRKAKR